LAISTQFCFSYSLGGVTAMPSGLHARLYHAFLVCCTTNNTVHLHDTHTIEEICT